MCFEFLPKIKLGLHPEGDRIGNMYVSYIRTSKKLKKRKTNTLWGNRPTEKVFNIYNFTIGDLGATCCLENQSAILC